MLYVGIFLFAAAAWYASCLFAALSPREATVNSITAGSCCALVVYLLSVIHIDLDISPLLFLLIAAVLPLQQGKDRAARLMVLLSALGAYAMLSRTFWQVRILLSEPAAGILLFFVAVGFSIVAHALRRWFPPEDWQEHFNAGSTDRVDVKRWHIWLVLGVMATLELALRYCANTPDELWQVAVYFAAELAIYGGAICIVCLMVICRRDRLAALVDQSYHQEMQSFMSVIRSQRHDYNFHVQTLAGLIDAGDIDQCRDYLHNLIKDSNTMNSILPVKDPAIAALIFSFRTAAQENGIELHADIQNDLSSVVTSVYETNKVIGNLLQNAIDEVRTHKDKAFGIHLYILKRGENCIIHVANKLQPREDAQTYLQEMYRPGYSTKAGHEGIGLTSIQNLLRRYRGVVYSRIEGDTMHCVAKIPLSMEGGEA